MTLGFKGLTEITLEGRKQSSNFLNSWQLDGLDITFGDAACYTKHRSTVLVCFMVKKLRSVSRIPAARPDELYCLLVANYICCCCGRTPRAATDAAGSNDR